MIFQQTTNMPKQGCKDQQDGKKTKFTEKNDDKNARIQCHGSF